MSRPTLVIGLGGTGSWVLTHLKRSLQETNGDVLPENIRLLAFDTEASAHEAPFGSLDSTPSTAKLIPGKEFQHLGGDLYGFARQVAEGEYPSIAEWFQADHWLSSVPRASFDLSGGGGQLRQLGRLALFYDLCQGSQSTIRMNLEQALHDLGIERQEQPFEVVVVASLAGGTGSGMFIDIALLARQLLATVPHVLTGFLALPSVFGSGGNPRTLWMAQAAWRELNRFMSTTPNFAVRIPDYCLASEDQQASRQLTSRLFDTCYLVEGTRGGERLDVYPEHAVFASVANAISVMLDDKAGKEYRSRLQNLTVNVALRPQTPLYSAVGTYALRIPFHSLREHYAHRLILQWLNAFLGPIQGSSFAPRSTEAWVSEYFHDALSFFTSEQNYQGHSEQPTLFTAHIARIVGRATEERFIASHVDPLSPEVKTLLKDFISFGDREDVRHVARDAQHLANLDVIKVIPSGRVLQEHPIETMHRFDRDISEWIRRNYGGLTASGEEFGGKFGEALDVCAKAQAGIFRRLLRLQLLRTLMRPGTADPIHESGGLGRAHATLHNLTMQLQSALDFMNKVREVRAKIQSSVYAEKGRERARNEMEKDSSRKFLFFTHPKAYASQIDYLRAVQGVVDLRKQELLHQAVVGTLVAILTDCKSLGTELNQWIEFLATGSPVMETSSIYSLLERSHQNSLSMREFDRQLHNVQTILEPEELQVDEEEVAALMRAVIWDFHEEPTRKWLSLQIKPRGEPAIVIQTPPSRCVQELLDYGRRRFQALSGDINIAEMLMRTYTTPNSFARTLIEGAGPLFVEAWSETDQRERLRFLCIDATSASPRAIEFLEEVEREMRREYGLSDENRGRDTFVRRVGAADPHRAVAFSTDHLLPPDCFQAWHEYSRFGGQISQPEMAHIFPAEANAVGYELRLAETRRIPYRSFHPRVAMLVEKPKLLRECIMCWALGWVKDMDDGHGAWLELQLVEGGSEGRTMPLTQKGPVVPDALEAVETFLHQVSTSKDLYQQIQEAVEAERRRIGVNGWIGLLRKQREGIDRKESLVAWLRYNTKSIVDSHSQPESSAQGGMFAGIEVYNDLAVLVELLLEEMLGRFAKISPLYLDALRFFREAGYSVAESPGDYVIVSPSQERTSFHRHPLCVTIHSEMQFDTKRVEHLYSIAKGKFKEVKDRIGVAIVDSPPSSGALGHIYGYRADQGLAIIVLPSSVLRDALSKHICNLELSTQIRRALGEVDLYKVSTPITDFLSFFGRVSLIEDILQVLGRGEHVGLFGLRKIGKTSLMWQTRQRLNEHPVAFVDLQAFGRDSRQLLPRIIGQFVDDITSKFPGVKLPSLRLVSFPMSTDYRSDVKPAQDLSIDQLIPEFESDIKTLYAALHTRVRNPRLVLFIDEAERMLPSDAQTGFADWEAFWAILRNMVQTHGILSIVVAAVDARLNRTDRLQEIDNPAYQLLAAEFFLPPFSFEENREMIVNIGSQMGIRWGHPALEAVHKASGGHPFISREICSLAVQQSGRAEPITTEHVASGVDKWLTMPNNYAQQVWASRLSDLERTLLMRLAAEQPLKVDELVWEYQTRESGSIQLALTSLTERHIVTEEDEAYRITFDVLRRWVFENTPTPQMKLEVDEGEE